jgi:hypothetical protein
MDNLLKLNDLVIIDTHLLLWGNSSLPADVNNCIFSHVQTYINETKRFNWCSYSVFTYIVYLYLIVYYHRFLTNNNTNSN